MQQARDFEQESESLFDLVSGLQASDKKIKTQFKQWTIDDILAHLHIFNHLAGLSLAAPDQFQEEFDVLMAKMKAGMSMKNATDGALEGLAGPELLQTWQHTYRQVAKQFADADPKKRLKWAGPNMSALSSISARLMETWAHGQAIYDQFGVERVDDDHIKNIAIMGINTFGWTFINRGWKVPADIPFVELTAPSGARWSWNEQSSDNFIKGFATEFCQVVTQTRNITDTRLSVTGKTASLWMQNAQCFAGPPNPPPEPGSRFRMLSAGDSA